MSKEIDIICETMHKSGVPLSEDQRAILAGCLAVLCDKQKIRTATLDEVMTEHSKKYMKGNRIIKDLQETIDNMRGESNE